MKKRLIAIAAAVVAVACTVITYAASAEMEGLPVDIQDWDTPAIFAAGKDWPITVWYFYGENGEVLGSIPADAVKDLSQGEPADGTQWEFWLAEAFNDYRKLYSAGEDKTANLREIERLVQTAAKNGAKMLFLPEYSMYYAKVNARSKNIEAAEPCDGPFIIALGELCRRYGLWIAAGMYERMDGLPYNTIAVLDDRGRLRGTHRKNRLYDAFGYRESDECRAGDKPFSPIETPVGKLGIITCFELRFPALAAEQKARGAETLFVPAGWVQGENKLLHWRTLLCARAIENGLTVLGADQYAPGKFVGHSMAFQPDGTALGELGEEQDLLIVKIN